MSERSVPSQDDLRLRLWSDLALLGLGSMEMIWVALWYRASFQPQISLPWGALWAVFSGILAVSYIFTRILQTSKLSWRARQGIFLGWIVLAGVLTLKWVVFTDQAVGLGEMLWSPVRSLTVSRASGLPFIHLLAVALLVVRGVALSHDLPGSRGALVDFQLGLIALLIYGVAYLPSDPEMSFAGLAFYLFNGLLVMGATRISGVSNFRGGRLPRLSVPWLAGVVFSALVLIGLGLLAGWFSSTQVIRFLVNLLLGLVGLVGMVLVVVLLPLFTLIMQAIANILQALAGLFDNKVFQQLKTLAEQSSEFADMLRDQIQQVSSVARVAIPLAVLAAIVVATLLWLRLREMRLNLRGEEDVAGLAPGSLRSLLNALLRQTRGSALVSPARWLAAERVRRIYADLLALSARLGTARPAASTPLEFLPQMKPVYPGNEEELEMITHAYLKVRYGEYPESSAEVEAVAGAWKRLQKAGRKALHPRAQQEPRI